MDAPPLSMASISASSRCASINLAGAFQNSSYTRTFPPLLPPEDADPVVPDGVGDADEDDDDD